MSRHSIHLVPSIVLLAFVGLACSASNSSETLSDSISSPFQWSSDSSGSIGGDSAYRQDVGDYTIAFTEQPGDWEAFRQGVGRLAEQRGITNWEGDVFTCASIGLGLQRADLDAGDAGRFGENLFGANSRSRSALLAGYASIP